VFSDNHFNILKIFLYFSFPLVKFNKVNFSVILGINILSTIVQSKSLPHKKLSHLLDNIFNNQSFDCINAVSNVPHHKS
jgi:hypothetical protein